MLRTMDGHYALQRLVGGDLDTVSFVRDYVEFRVDCNVLRALTAPEILLPNGQSHRFPNAGSRDALCTLIDASVVEASERGSEDANDQRIEVRTDAGHLLTIPLNASSEWVQRQPISFLRTKADASKRLTCGSGDAAAVTQQR